MGIDGPTFVPKVAIFERRFVLQVAPQIRKLLPQAELWAIRPLSHDSQEGCCRTTGKIKKVFAAPQVRRFLPYHREEGFCHTTGKRAFAAPQARWFCCRTTGEQYSCHSR